MSESNVTTVKVDVEMTTKKLFKYMMANTTFGVAGKIKWAVSLMALVMLPFSITLDNNMIPMGLFMIVLMYLIIQPFLLFTSAKKQMIENPVFKAMMSFVFDESGMALNQTIDSGMMPWEDIWMMREIKDMFLVYLQPGRALVVSKEKMSKEDVSNLRMVIKNSGIKARLKKK